MKKFSTVFLMCLFILGLSIQSCTGDDKPSTDEATYTKTEAQPKNDKQPAAEPATENPASTAVTPEPTTPTPAEFTGIYGSYVLDKKQSSCEMELEKLIVKKDETVSGGFIATLHYHEPGEELDITAFKGKMTGAKTFYIPKQSSCGDESDDQCHKIEIDGQITDQKGLIFNATSHFKGESNKCKMVFKQKAEESTSKIVVEEKVYTIVEDMPRFPGCEEGTGTNAEKNICAEKKLLKFVYANIKYPPIARENNVEGMAVVQFIIEKDGTLGTFKILRDPGSGLGTEALRVLKSMNTKGLKWTSGKQRGKAVNVQLNLPVRFKLPK